MANARKTYQYNGVHAAQATFPGDASIVVPVIGANGWVPAISPQVSMAVALVNKGQTAPQIGLGEAGDQLLGKLVIVEPDGTCAVQDEGYMYLPFNTSTPPVPGGGVVVDGAGAVQRGAVQVAANEVQTITVTATDGLWSLTLLGQTFAGLEEDIPNATLQALLVAAFGASSVVVTGTPLTNIILTFGGPLAAQDIPLATLGVAGLIGGTMTIAETTKGEPASGGVGAALCVGYGLDPMPIGAETAATTYCIVKK